MTTNLNRKECILNCLYNICLFRIAIAWCLLTFACNAWSQEVETVLVKESHRGWSIKPFRHGFSVMERKYGISTYDGGNSKVKGSRFPIDRVAGTVRIPVFLVDWSDFDPAKDPSNKDNPRSKGNPTYKRRSVDEIQAHLNSDAGPSGYYNAASGGQLIVKFDVFPWISSKSSQYLKDKEPAYYNYVERRKRWVANKKPHALDVLRAAIVEKGFDPRKYDIDNNKVLDGLIIGYEGSAGQLAGKNMSSLCPLHGTMGNFKELLPEDDPNSKRTKEMDLLYNRCINQPEDVLMELRTTVHEVGHMLLGYTDYYNFGSIGEYALSARGAKYSPAAMEKWIFGKWLSPQAVTGGELTLDNHHLNVGDVYSSEKTYLHQVFIDNDPFHYFLIENRFFDAKKRYFDKCHFSSSARAPDSGLVVFEINENLANRKKWKGQSVKRHLPEYVKGKTSIHRSLYKRRTFQQGEDFHYKKDAFELHITNISKPGETLTYNLKTTAAKDDVSPSAPSSITVSILGDSSATVSWSKAEDNTAVSGYVIDVALDEEFNQLHTEYANKNVRLNTDYALNKLKQGTTYYLRLRTMDIAGNISEPTATQSFKTESK